MVKWTEELHDMLLGIILLVVALCFYTSYWQEEFRIRYAGMVVDDFLCKVAAKGSVTIEEYETLKMRISEISTRYCVELMCHERKMEPCYALIPKEQLEKYYSKRNVRKKKVFDEDISDELFEEMEQEKLQEETNASILSSTEQFLPLPQLGDITVEAVRKKQKVYEGEELITLCIFSSEQGSCYVEAASMVAEQTGTVELVVEIEGRTYYAEVEVVCYPREKICIHGHKYPNTKERIVAEEEGEEMQCPLCERIPVNMECNTVLAYHRIGQKLSKEQVWLKVLYMDGHEEIITPDSKEWLDDFDEEFCGLQSVTIQYRGVQQQVVVITEAEPCLKCGKLCEGKCYADYQAFPYCVQCMSEVPLFTGELYETEIQKNESVIIQSLKQEERFCMEKGDFLTVHIRRGKDYVFMKQVSVKKRRGE